MYELEGPVIYGRELNDEVYFSTSAEPEGQLGAKSLLPIYKLKKASHLYKYNKLSKVLEKISQSPKDSLNPFLFGFGSYQFPLMEKSEELFVNKVGLKHETDSKYNYISYDSYEVYDLDQ